MNSSVQHLYKSSIDGDGLLYAWFPSMHTRVDLMLCSRMPEEELMHAVGRISKALGRLEKIANYYDPASELAAVNRKASTSPVSLSRELYTMIEMCLQYHEKTLGCFDVTVHSDHYHPDTIRSVCLSADEQSVFFRQPGVTINLSGFLKGYALEVIREILNSCMIKNALVNMGNSSVLALGSHPAGSGWKVYFGSNCLDAGRSGREEGILLHNECLTTSGNDSEGRKHIISPQSGALVEGMKQVSVVTANGAVGEILSTSLFVAGCEQRDALLASFRPLLNNYFLIGC